MAQRSAQPGRDAASLRQARARVAELELSQSRLASLVELVVELGTDLDLHSVLERIVRAACQLSDARYGALGVLSKAAGPRLADFITHGLSAEEIARIGALPEGHGILGVLVDDPQNLRLSRIGDDPRSVGFPPGHPPMRTFLGVPVRVRDQVFGNLYLTDKRGGDDFTNADEQAVMTLATAAGWAIENASLYEGAERRRRWLEASTEITQLLLGRVDRDQALQLIARRARELSDSALGAIVLQSDEGELVVEVVDGPDSADLGRALGSEDGPAGDVLRTGHSVVVDDVAAAAMRRRGEQADPAYKRLGRAVFVPLRSPAGRDGVLIVAAHRDAKPAEDGEVDMIESFAGHAALALERAQAQQDRALLAVLDDRDRIARDLHDLVIQRLFATGLQLQGANRLAVRPEVQERINASVEDLDATIRDIRAAIFELQHRPGQSDIRADVRSLVGGYTGALGFTPRLEIRGPLDTGLPPLVRPHLLAVLREALSNVARHAHATQVTVEVEVTAPEACARVSDNGVGIAGQGRHSGLRNIRDRAADLGGSLELTPNGPAGTVLEWRVPIGKPSPA